MEEKHKMIVYSDGGSKGNPGPAAIGIILVKEDKIIEEYSEFIGIATNNQAEYKALIKALDLCLKYKETEILCYSDSILLVNQANGNFKVRNRSLYQLYIELKAKEKNFLEVKYNYVPRENPFIARADSLLHKRISS